MFWATGLILGLAISQVPADLVKPDFIENVAGIAFIRGQERILSGWAAYPGQIPHQTSLRMVNSAGGVSGCGGSVVSREWVITSAHCTAGQITVVVRAGLTSLLYPAYIYETQEWYNHPTYNDNNPGLVQPNDIAALKLQRPLTYSRLLQPIRIQPSAEAFNNYDGETVIASGFGRTWTDGATSEELNWVYMRATSNAWCAAIYGTALITDNAICAQFYNVTTQSVCQGDSGGPLVHINQDGVPTLIGVTSFVAGGEHGCHSAHPAGFIRPGPFLAWLEEVTGIDFENLNEEEEVPSTPMPEEPTTTVAPEVPTTGTDVPTTEPDVPTTEPDVPTTEPDLPTTEPDVPTTVTDIQTTPAPTTTVRPSQPEEESDEDEDDDDDDSSEEEDPEISELLKQLIVKVKVKVKINDKLKKKVKVKCVDNF